MFLIDGYNFLHFVSPAATGSESRERLLGVIASWCREGGYRARVVFDPTADLPARGRRGDLEIRGVAPGRTADEEIVAALRTTPDRTAFTVVTDDREIAKAARRGGFEVSSCEDFARLIRSSSREASEKGGEPSPGEVDFWMKEFGLED